MGFYNPEQGCNGIYAHGMTSETRRRKVAGFMRVVLANNVNALMELRFRTSPNKPLALAKRAGISLSSVQRVLNQQAGASIDTIEALAAAFDLSGYQLLIPELHIQAPQEIVGAQKAEERAIRAWKASALQE
jgi:transcriptional regulator with XRE-family HTH domain